MTRRESTSRETIPIGPGRSLSIIVVRLSTQGAGMAKRGRKSKEGQARFPNGRIKPATQERLNAMNHEATMKIKECVMNQPHRRNAQKPDDEWLAFAAGRFCRAYGVHQNVKDACDEWLNIERRWQAGYGVPMGFERHDGGSGRGPTEEQMRTWLAKLQKVERTIEGNPKFGPRIFAAIQRLVIDDEEFAGKDDPELIRSALAELEAVLSTTGRSLHPFRSAA